MAAPQGVEPRYAAPEAAVLPLNEGAASAKQVNLAAVLATPLQNAGPESQLVHDKWYPGRGQSAELHPRAAHGIHSIHRADALLIAQHFKRAQSENAVARKPARHGGKNRCAH
jgi:hypothetical protein